MSTPFSRSGRMASAAAVIARRDFVATVWSRSFLLFLLGPLIAVAFGGVLGSVGNQVDGVALQPEIVFVVAPSDTPAIKAAYQRLDERIDDLPTFRFEAPAADAAAQARALLAEPKRNVALVVSGWPKMPRIAGSKRAIDANAPMARLVMEEAATASAMSRGGMARPRFDIAFTNIERSTGGTSTNRYILARGAQTMLFMLTILLAGMLLSNLVEEKSNKVIEVLAAAVPVDAVFLGKLIAMLGVSLIGVSIWGGLIGGGLVAAFKGQAIPDPAVGWPVFVIFGLLYFITNYLILGGLFLAIGSQAASVRDVQTLSMPVTMMQLAIFAAGSAVVNDLDKPMGILAAVFPLTSPLTMIARAAQDGGIGVHLLALAWQALWVFLIVRFAARRFRISVLKSGGPKKKFWSRKPA